VQLLPAAADRRDQAGRLQQGEVLADGLARHVEAGAQLAQGLAVAGVQAVEQPAPARIGQRPEHVVARVIGSHLAADIRQPHGCMSSRSWTPV
jgi:hypothetical protein